MGCVDDAKIKECYGIQCTHRCEPLSKEEYVGAD